MKLSYILVPLILVELLWVILIPIWQFPDEQAHFSQIQNIAEKNKPTKTSTSREVLQSEKILGTERDGLGNNSFTYHPDYNIPYSQTGLGINEVTIKQIPYSYRHDLVINEATAYPPLYYKIMSFGYLTFYNSDLILRLYGVRLFNLVFYIFSVVIVYEIANLLFRTSKTVIVALVILFAMHPMFSFVAAGVNSDNLFNLLFTLSIYLALLILSGGWNWKIGVSVIFTLILSFYTKPQAALILFVFLFPCGRSIFFSNQRKKAYLLSGAFLLLVIVYIAKIIMSGQQLLPDVANFKGLLERHDPTLLMHLKNTLIHTYREVIPWYWGIFRWLSLAYPHLVNRVINWVCIIAIVGLALRLVKKSRGNEFIADTHLWFLLHVNIVYFLGITLYDWLFIKSHGFSVGIQGRYFFPPLATQMALILVGVMSIIPNRWRLWGVKLLVLGMILLHIFAVYWVSISYYSSGQLYTFLIQASQYKPQLFKYPYLLIWIILGAASFLILIGFIIKLPSEVTKIAAPKGHIRRHSKLSRKY